MKQYQIDKWDVGAYTTTIVISTLMFVGSIELLQHEQVIPGILFIMISGAVLVIGVLNILDKRTK